MTQGILRIATAGSVDNGKSTLIGRLLYDSKSIYEDQLSAVERTSAMKGKSDIDLSLFTDGLRDEVALGITIDVAYRYFSTPKRKFIIADTPGHAEFTRNMITGASTTDAIIILIDVTLGITEQTKRHSFLAGLLRLSSVIVCVNKMDLVDWERSTFDALVRDFEKLEEQFKLKNVVFVPVSALNGDNVVDRSVNMSWYTGNSLMELLEDLPSGISDEMESILCLVQCELGTQEDQHYFGVRMLNGTLQKDVSLYVYPSMELVKIGRLINGYEETETLTKKMTGNLMLLNGSLNRGDILTELATPPLVNNTFLAMICWLSELDFEYHKQLILQHVTGDFFAEIAEIQYVVDMKNLERVNHPKALTTNDIARVKISLDKPIAYDSYEQQKEMGSFILIDAQTNETVAAGMIE